ncbi:MAG: hypothetical protein CMH61_01065 [Nanoarchaeota archaeon]|nr:hypothetical protein [Nanoarchaeota archaeon]|tara:strand:- start:766 stop:1182 length:417 start_codon:yes stop_codon:yes gene_type:complete
MKLFRRLVLYGAFVVGLYSCSPGQQSSETGMSITSADFDHDGDLDLIIGAKFDNGARLTYLQNKGNGQFASPTPIAKFEITPDTGMSITSGDFDQDGDLDFIVGTKSTMGPEEKQGRLYSFVNDGQGNFQLRKDRYQL